MPLRMPPSLLTAPLPCVEDKPEHEASTKGSREGFAECQICCMSEEAVDIIAFDAAWR